MKNSTFPGLALLLFIGLFFGSSARADEASWRRDANELIGALKDRSRSREAFLGLQVLVLRHGPKAFAHVQERLPHRSALTVLEQVLGLRHRIHLVQRALPALADAKRIRLADLGVGPDGQPIVLYRQRAWLLEETEDALLCLCDPVPPNPLRVERISKSALTERLGHAGLEPALYRKASFAREVRQMLHHRYLPYARFESLYEKLSVQAPLFAAYAHARRLYPEALHLGRLIDRKAGLLMIEIGLPFGLCHDLSQQEVDHPGGRDRAMDLRRVASRPVPDMRLPDPDEGVGGLVDRLVDQTSLRGGTPRDLFSSPPHALNAAVRLAEAPPAAVPLLIDALSDRRPSRTVLREEGEAYLLRVCDWALLILEIRSGKDFGAFPLSRGGNPEEARLKAGAWWEKEQDRPGRLPGTAGPHETKTIQLACRRLGLKAVPFLRKRLDEIPVRFGLTRYVGDEGFGGLEERGENRRRFRERMAVARMLESRVLADPLADLLDGEWSKAVGVPVLPASLVPEERPAIVRALARSGQRGWFELFRRAEKLSSPELRQVAWKALAEQPPAHAAEHLLPLLAGPALAPDTKRDVVRALARSGTEVWPRLVRLARRSPNTTLAGQVVQELGRAGGLLAVPRLIPFLDDRRPADLSITPNGEPRLCDLAATVIREALGLPVDIDDGRWDHRIDVLRSRLSSGPARGRSRGFWVAVAIISIMMLGAVSGRNQS